MIAPEDSRKISDFALSKKDELRQLMSSPSYGGLAPCAADRESNRKKNLSNRSRIPTKRACLYSCGLLKLSVFFIPSPRLFIGRL